MQQSAIISLFRQYANDVNDLGTFIDLNGKDQRARLTELSSLTQNAPLPVIALMQARSNFDPTKRTNNRHQFIFLILDQSTPGAASDITQSALIDDATDEIISRMEQLAHDFTGQIFSVQAIKQHKWQLDGTLELTAEKNILSGYLTGVSMRFTLIDTNRC